MKLGDAAQTAKGKAVAAEAETGRLSAELALRNGEVARLNAELRAALTKNATIIGNFEKKNGELERTRQRLVETEALAASRLQTLEAAAAENNRRRADSVARLSTPAGSDKDARRESDSNVQGDKALREAISQLAADVARLSEAPADASPRLPPGKIRNRDSRAPSSQGPDTADSVASANLRQLQPTAPER